VQPIKEGLLPLTNPVKKRIIQFEKQGIKPKRMITLLRDSGIAPPLKSQINTFLKTFRKNVRSEAVL
jgi:hypothetical protein